VAVSNSIKAGPLVFLLQIFVITENIVKHPVQHNVLVILYKLLIRRYETYTNFTTVNLFRTIILYPSLEILQITINSEQPTNWT
jgi:hypothetical protein